LIFDGDSDIDYMPAEWATLYPASYNVGVGGDTCEDVVNRAAGIISVLKPSTVVIICGENDLAYGSNVETTFGRFKAAVAFYNAARVEVIYIGAKPEPDTTSLHNEYNQYDTKIKAYTANRELTMIDLFYSFEDLGNPSTLYRSDNLHMSELGYSYVASWLDIELADTSGCDVWRSGTCTQDDSGEINPFPSVAPISSPTAAASPSTAPVSFVLPLLMLSLLLIEAQNE
jgi:lysophospholipase L1-like esterase